MPVAALFLNVQLHGLSLHAPIEAERIRARIDAALRKEFSDMLGLDSDLDIVIDQYAGTFD